MAAPREFGAYPPRAQRRSMWSSPMVRLIVGLLVLFFISQLVLYRMAVASVRSIKSAEPLDDGELDFVTDMTLRFKRAWHLLQF
ncbi:hypothetical protein KFE25_013278 [Diacronema lutheri]|uniref:Uncharacterized protein n=1 Tax=Diacronema lutheri TaxID=2081491 RepID=A0A8J5XUI4_DIALT|nr:hypothetical protein KFE25_013278 [Diacronema lutheri]